MMDELKDSRRGGLGSVVPILILTCFIPGLPEQPKRKFIFQDLLEPIQGDSETLCPLRFITLENVFPSHQETRQNQQGPV